MNRRQFMASLAWAGASLPAKTSAKPVSGSVLVHEHILVDFIGANQIHPGRYNAKEVFQTALPHLKRLAEFGCTRLQECTPNYLGRNPELLSRLSDATGLSIWTNTGLYAASNHKFLPEFAKKESAEQLARRWIGEARNGISGIKPRFIKIGVNRGPLHPLDRKIVQAAGLASRETGLTIAAHTGDGAAAIEELEILTQTGCPPSRFVWVHAHSERNQAIHEQVARAGAWVEFDGIAPGTTDWHYKCLEAMANHHLLERVLISQDAGWYHVGELNGSDYRGYTSMYTDFLPRLPTDWISQLLVKNPRIAFGKD